MLIYLGLLSEDPHRLRHLTVYINAFDKNVTLYPVSRKIIIAVLDTILKRYIPENGSIKILSDQGKQFQHVLWSTTFENNGIQLQLFSDHRVTLEKESTRSWDISDLLS